jgi:ABC-type amino acid transport system permease subunit
MAERGQATVELVAALPALLLAALVALQLLAAGYAMTLADGAAEAGALALASGGSAAEAARAALPGWAKDDVSVAVAGGTVSVRLRPPSPIPALSKRLTIDSSASAKAAR